MARAWKGVTGQPKLCYVYKFQRFHQSLLSNPLVAAAFCSTFDKMASAFGNNPAASLGLDPHQEHKTGEIA
jgi:hypothetical protein